MADALLAQAPFVGDVVHYDGFGSSRLPDAGATGTSSVLQ